MWHMSTTNKLLQTTVQKHNTINEILFCRTSYTGTYYIYPTTISGNLKWKQCSCGREFKLKVVQYANNCHNNRQTAREFSCFREASVQLVKIHAWISPDAMSKEGMQREEIFIFQEEWELKDRIFKYRQQGYVVTSDAIRMKVKQIINDESFLASAGWCTHFMWRNKLVLRQKTKICQCLPTYLEITVKTTSFQCFMIHQRLRHLYLLSHIGNMDETPVFLTCLQIECGFCRFEVIYHSYHGSW